MNVDIENIHKTIEMKQNDKALIYFSRILNRINAKRGNEKYVKLVKLELVLIITTYFRFS